ncbi:MAG: adenylate/guanylate cyclase domain-containing protein [Candidatus Binatia bacterium]
MTEETSSGRSGFFCSIVFKNIFLFLLILLVAVVPLAFRYYQESRNYEIKVLASRLEFFAERGATWLDPGGIHALRTPAHKQTKNYQDTVRALSRIEKEFKVDNAVVMRRREDSSYEYVAVGANAFRGSSQSSPGAANPCSPAAARNPCSPAGSRSVFDIGRPVHIHSWFPATYQSTEDTWQAGRMMHSQLFGGKVGNREFDQFLQINTPLKLNGRVVAILMLNKFAKPVAEKVRMNTLRLFGFTAGILVLGLILFGVASSRMLRLLRDLTSAAEEVSHGNLEVTIPKKRSSDEVGRLANAFESMIGGLKQRHFIRDTFGRYISQQVVDELLSSPDRLRLGGELREVTFLVSDLRGFTALSSRMKPDEVIQIVNRFLEPMVDIITRYRGTVDEFQGDGILAFFGAPLAATDDPERAVACAVEMQRALVEVNTEQRQRGLPELHMGIGISTGEVIVGNIGSEKRTKYGALGTPINMAYRIESYTVSGQVLISPSTYERVKDVVRVGDAQDLQFKGLDELIQVYEVKGLDGDYACSMPEEAPEHFLDLDPPLSLECFILEGKTISDKAIAGRIERLSENCAQGVLDEVVEKNMNLMVRIAPYGAGRLSEVYAKVMETDPASGSSAARIVLNFTSLPEDAKAFLEQRRTAALRA